MKKYYSQLMPIWSVCEKLSRSVWSGVCLSSALVWSALVFLLLHYVMLRKRLSFILSFLQQGDVYSAGQRTFVRDWLSHKHSVPGRLSPSVIPWQFRHCKLPQCTAAAHGPSGAVSPTESFSRRWVELCGFVKMMQPITNLLICAFVAERFPGPLWKHYINLEMCEQAALHNRVRVWGPSS